MDTVCDQYVELVNYVINHSRIGNHFSMIFASRGCIILIGAHSQTAHSILVLTLGGSMSFVINSQVKANEAFETLQVPFRV
jgi:hypothetical protein